MKTQQLNLQLPKQDLYHDNTSWHTNMDGGISQGPTLDEELHQVMAAERRMSFLQGQAPWIG